MKLDQHPEDPTSHQFHRKNFRHRFCDHCKGSITGQGVSCKACKYACHKECEVKVAADCEPMTYELRSPALVKAPDKIRRSRSLDRHPTFAMDITYVTERIIVVVFPKTELDITYKSNLKDVTRMLRTKHGTNYMVFNLSEKRYDLAKFNSRVLEFGWPKNLAPPLERLCSICKSIDSWINSDPQNIAVIHSKGDKGRAGIIIAAYMHYSNICASADQALDRFAMKQFYDDKLYIYMQPSQKRYVHYFAGLLSGSIRMNNNPLYLHRIIIHGVPNFDSRGGCKPFVKIYQGMQQLYSSGVYSVTDKNRKVVINLESSLQIHGDIFVKCYHKSQRPLARYPIFQVQFHTCTVESNHLFFEKNELDCASSDSRFPAAGRVEFNFSYYRDSYKGNTPIQESSILVENANDPLVKWDSYENFDIIPEDSIDDIGFLDGDFNHVLYTEGPLDGSLYATVTKKKYTDVLIHPNINADTFADIEGPHSIDSGISSSSGLRNPDMDSHNPDHITTRRSLYSNTFKDEQAELDELVHGMLKEIQSIPDTPVYSSLRPFTSSLVSQSPRGRNTFSTITTTTTTHGYRNPNEPTSIVSVNGTKQVNSPGAKYSERFDDFVEEDDVPFHARKVAHPFTYLGSQSPTRERRRLLSDGHEPIGLQQKQITYMDSPRFRGDNSWLQRQQEKLRARREGRGWEDRQHKELLLLNELRRTHKKPFHNGESLDDVSLGLEFSSSSRETSPPKGLSYTLPLHVNTYNGHSGSVPPPGGVLKPPVYRNTSAPSSPLLPQRSSSKEITRYRYPQFQTQSKTLTRQKSDTSFDRERPFVAVKKQIASNQATSPHNVIAYGNVYTSGYKPASKSETDPGLLGLLGTSGKVNGTSKEPANAKLDKLEQTLQALSSSSGSPAGSPNDPQHSQFIFSQSTPNKPHLASNGTSWSPSVIGSSPPGSPSRIDRPITPAFPVPPATPYQNQDATGSALPPRSPLTSRKDRSPSPAAIQNMQHELIRANSSNGQSSPTVYYGQSRPSSMISLTELADVIHQHPMFVKDTSKFWYKPNISREEAISILKDKAPGTFVVRDSNSFPGAYGLALKVATPPPNVSVRSGDLSSELVRHFLIEPTSKGVRLKGCPNEPIFGSLSALVYQHSITALALPTKLVLPEQDPMAEVDGQSASHDSLLEHGAACSVLYLNTVEMESLTGPQAVKKALTETLARKPLPMSVPVHFKVSGQGITLTDNTRKSFFRRHYPVKAISHCGLDMEDRKWVVTNEDGMPLSTSRVFGFVARKPTSHTDNQCHIFAEMEPEQPASAIVNFVTRVMMSGSQQQSGSHMV